MYTTRYLDRAAVVQSYALCLPCENQPELSALQRFAPLFCRIPAILVVFAKLSKTIPKSDLDRRKYDVVQ